DPRHEPRQPVLGRSPDPRRTGQTRHRCGSDLSRQVYGKTPETSIAGWRTFLRNHADGIAAMDLFVVPTLYLVRDHDSVYGEIFPRRLRAMGIRDRPIAPAHPGRTGMRNG